MANLHFFNPENDLALASGLTSYTPPAAARNLRRGSCLLPMLWADDDDRILVIDEYSEAEELRMRQLSGFQGEIVRSGRGQHLPQPWGWSHYAASLFERLGVDSALLPSQPQLEAYRELSHRRTAIEILRQLNYPSELLPVEAFTAAEARAAVDRFGRAVVKQPWSCSGRGVFFSPEMAEGQLSSIIEASVRRQGRVIVEPMFDRELDFACLFRSSDGKVSFEGFSMFQTSADGRYGGNVVAPQDYIASRLPLDILSPIIPRLEDILTRLTASTYEGWMGVDMLSYRSADGDIQIAPCIELNLRRTMGVAALEFARRHPQNLSQPILLAATPSGVTLNPLA